MNAVVEMDFDAQYNRQKDWKYNGKKQYEEAERRFQKVYAAHLRAPVYFNGPWHRMDFTVLNEPDGRITHFVEFKSCRNKPAKMQPIKIDKLVNAKLLRDTMSIRCFFVFKYSTEDDSVYHFLNVQHISDYDLSRVAWCDAYGTANGNPVIYVPNTKLRPVHLHD